MVLSSRDVTFPLRDHLLSTTRKKILFYQEPEEKAKERVDDRETEKLKCRLSPWRSTTLFHYSNIIYKAYSCFTGTAWLQYDEKFWMSVAINPTLPWDQTHLQLGLPIMSTTCPSWRDCSHSGLLVDHSQIASSPHISAGQSVQSHLLCWVFSSQGSCSQKNCACHQ